MLYILVVRRDDGPKNKTKYFFLCFVYHASLYNLVNKANLMHNFS